MTQDLRGLQTAFATAKEIRVRILKETGLTASAGISYNKFLAKLASSQLKPNGQFVITPEMGPDFIASLPGARFHGVGPRHRGKDAATRHSDGSGSADLQHRPATQRRHFTTANRWSTGAALCCPAPA